MLLCIMLLAHNALKKLPAFLREVTLSRTWRRLYLFATRVLIGSLDCLCRGTYFGCTYLFCFWSNGTQVKTAPFLGLGL